LALINDPRNTISTLFPYTTLFRSTNLDGYRGRRLLSELKFPEGKLRLIEKWKSYPDYLRAIAQHKIVLQLDRSHVPGQVAGDALDRKSTRLNSSHQIISYAVFCLK